MKPFPNSAACLLLILAALPLASTNSLAACVTPPAGLVSWWGSEGNGLDSAGSNDVSLLNGVTYGIGKVGMAFNLNGNNQYAVAPASPTLDVGPGGGFTIEGWIYPTSVTSRATIVEFARTGSYGISNAGVQLCISAGAAGNFWANIVDTNGGQHIFYTPGNLIRASNWYHVALSYSSTSGLANLYVGGFSFAQANLGSLVPQTAYDLVIGASTALGSPGAPTNAFPGLIDELSLYTRKLSATELGQILSAGASGKCTTAQPLIVYDLSRDFSTNLNPVGVWSYGWKSNVSAGFNVYTNPYRQFNYVWPAGSYLDMWMGTPMEQSAITHNTMTNSVFTQNGLEEHLPSATVLWPAPAGRPDNFTAVRFTAPVYGLYRVNASAQNFIVRFNPSDVDFHVVQNGLEVFNRNLAANSVGNTNRAGYTNTVILQPGTALDFLCGRGLDNDFNGSALRLDVTVSLLTNNPTCFTPPPGMVAWWKGDSNTLDSVGDNDGIGLAGLNYVVPAKVGPGFRFTGASEYVLVPAYSDLNVGAGPGFTVELWINPSTLSGGQFPLVEWGDNDSPLSPGVHFWHSPPAPWGYADGCLYANLIDTNNVFHSFSSPPNLVRSNVWQHAALTYNKASGIACMYLDGNLVAQTNAGTFTPCTTNHMHFGWRPGYPLSSYVGGLDEIGLYNRALSADEIAGISAAGSLGKCPPSCVTPPPGLVSWWRGENNTLDSADGNHASNVNYLAYYNAGAVGRCFAFSNAISYARVAPATNLAALGQGNGFTIELWLNPLDIVTERPLVEWNNGGSDGGSAYGVHFWISTPGWPGSGPGCVYANVFDTARVSHCIWSSTGLVQSNIWQHAALTYDKTVGLARLYLNGQLVAQTNLGIFTPQTSYPLYLGRRPSVSPIRSFSGKLDEITLYNRALTADEIGSIYTAGQLGKCLNLDGPIVLTHPQSQTVVVGANVTFTVSASGTQPLFYQWRKDGTNIPGATGTSLTLTNVQPAQAGYYSVQVTNVVNAVLSSNALLTILVPPSIVQQPLSRTVLVGTNVSFSVVASGTEPLHYQWRFNGSDIPGANNTNLALTNVQLAHQGYYSVRVTNLAGAAVSVNAGLTVNLPICVPSVSGLVSWWRGENNTIDAMGNNDGIPFSNLSYATGHVGRAFSFDGSTNGYVKVPASSSLNLATGGGLTLEGWIKPRTLDNQILMAWRGGTNSGVTFWHTASLHCSLDLAHPMISSPPVLSTNVFQHVAVTYDQTSGLARLYHNGRVVGESNLGSFVPQTMYDLYLGATPMVVSTEHNGEMDELAIYRRALNSNEIAGLYYAQVSGKCLARPVIMVQPLANQTAVAGTNVSLNVEVVGTAPLSYQWQFNGTNLPDATSRLLMLNNVQPANAGYYTVIVTNEVGSDASARAWLSVIVPPLITLQPINQMIVEGSNVTFTVAATGTLPLSYQWRWNDTNIAGATNTSLTLSNVPYACRGTYSALVSNVAGVALSANAMLMVDRVPVAFSQVLTVEEDQPLPMILGGSDADGDAMIVGLATLPSHGTLTGSLPTLTYMPATNYVGPDSFTFTVSDGLVSSAPATVNITVLPGNHPPVAYAQTISLDEDTTTPVTLGATDPDGDTLFFAVEPPSHGVLSGTAPDLVYRPNTNYFGTDQFTFTAWDGSVTSAPATITLTVRPVNDPPVACAGADQVLDCNGWTNAVTLDGTGSSDLEGDILEYFWRMDSALLGTNPVLNVSLAPGPHTINLEVRDTGGLSAQDDVQVQVLDTVAPDLVCPTNITVEFENELGARVEYSITATDLCSTVTLTCVPAPGSVFPIGSTRVLCIATDASSNNASFCNFQVEVLGAKGLKQNVLAELRALRAQPLPPQEAHQLDEAIRKLAESLTPEYWLDQAHLQPKHGEKAFNDEKQCVQKLVELSKFKKSLIPGSMLQNFVDRIVRADRLLATVELQSALRGDPKALEQARAELAKGDADALSGNFAVAIEHYRIAWKHALHGLIRTSYAPESGFHLEFLGEPETTYFIQASTNLRDWVTIGEVTADANGTVAFDDPNTAPKRFYRITRP